MRGFALEQQKRLAASLVRVLALYRPLTDAYVIEFFSDDLWGRLPRGWQAALGELSPPEVAALLLRKGRPGELWPLSLLAFRAAAHALPFPRRPAAAAREPPLPPRFRRHLRPKKQHEVRQLAQVLKRLSELTGCRRVVDVGAGQGHLARFLAFGLRLSVTAVEGDARLVAQAAKFDRALALELEKERARRQAPDTPPVQGPSLVVGWINPDTPWPEFVQLLRSGKAVGDGSSRGTTSGRQPTQPCEPRETEAGKGGADRGGNGPDSLEQNPPTHLQAQYPQGPLLLTGLHACGDLSATLLRLFVACPDIVGITSVSCCYMKLSTGEGTQPGYPLSNWVAGLPGHQLSYKAREGACHAMEDYILRLEHNSPSLKTHCYRARLETLIRAIDPTKKRLGVQAIPKTHEMTFEQYARRGLERVGMSPSGPLEPASPAQQQRVVVFFSLALLLAPLVETLILLDRMIYLQEQGFPCELVPLFNPALSARNLVLVAAKKVPPSDLWGLAAGD
ncbi:methyltransferase-like protein 25B isoform X3 [Ahaetulla prasina]|uniref:methyltransferase-like protein 25B isoform X3 n=1 Tax=Ahaetulla prasina TaxID=499056 RepID=UPI0026477644|nr:methyltransferase-like protein 25B isoform X3 [Ahaetulla prasina]